MAIKSKVQGKQGTVISAHSLCRQVQHEIVELGTLAQDIQKAIGIACSTKETLHASTYASLQSIDMLTQTLDDLQRVVGIVATLTEKDGPFIDTAALKEKVRLGDLSARLLTPTSSQPLKAHDDVGDVAWF